MSEKQQTQADELRQAQNEALESACLKISEEISEIIGQEKDWSDTVLRFTVQALSRAISKVLELKSPTSREHFEQEYATRSGLTIERFHELGLRAEPCDCGDLICNGWQVVSQEEPRIWVKHPAEKE